MAALLTEVACTPAPVSRRRGVYAGAALASELMQGALPLIRADGNKLVTGCSFVVDFLRRRREFSDLVR